MPIDQALVAFKKLFNKPHTSVNNSLIANEALDVGFSVHAGQVFAEVIDTSAGTNLPAFYDNDLIIEKVRLDVTFFPGSDSILGRHGFEISLPTDYEANTTNPKAGVFPFVDGQKLSESFGLLQIVPRFMGGADFRPELRDSTTTEIPPLDIREWILYEFGGIVFQEVPPGTGADPSNPTFVDCYIFIGEMATGSTSAQGNAIILDVAQAAHGFSVGEIIRRDDTTNTWVLALADTAENAESLGMVSTVTDVNNLELTMAGFVDLSAIAPALNDGDAYFLDDAIAGTWNPISPAAGISKPVFVAISTDTIIFYNLRGLVGGGAAGQSLQGSYDSSPVTARNIILSSAANEGVLIRDGAVSSGVAFDVQDNTSASVFSVSPDPTSALIVAINLDGNSAEIILHQHFRSNTRIKIKPTS